MKRTLIGFLVAILLAHVILEILLFSAGRLILWMQERQNLARTQGKESYKILCLGESTTMLGGKESYPSQLEKILKERLPKKNIQVINKGVAGIDSSYILSHAPAILDTYHPHLVVVMMGINDYVPGIEEPSRDGWGGKLKEILSHSKVVKFYRWVFSSLKPKSKVEKPTGKEPFVEPMPPQSLAEFKASGHQDDPKVALYVMAMMKYSQGEFLEAERLMKIVIDQNFFPHWWKLMYQQLAKCYLGQRKFDDYINTFEHIPHDSWHDLPFIEMCSSPVLGGKIEKFLQKQIKADPLHPAYNDFMAECLTRANKSGAEKFREKAKEIRDSNLNPYTKNNFLQLAQVLAQRPVKVVYMQYPVRSITPLKEMLKDAPKYADATFVDNEKIFKDALKTATFKEYFSDRFAGDFGHCTPKCNGLLAENLAKTIGPIVSEP